MKERTLAALISYVVCKALGDGLDVPEGRLPRACAQQPDRLKNNQKVNSNFSTLFRSD